MAEGKKAFIVYVSWNEAVRELNDKQAGQLFKWLLSYCDDENPTIPNDVAVKILCKTYQPILKRDLKKYENKVISIQNAREKRKNSNQNNIEINTDINNEINTETTPDINIASSGVNSNKLLVNSNKLLVSKDININNTPCPKNANASGVCDTKIVSEREMLFEKFWKAYPRKEGKQKCLNWFLNKSRNITSSLVNQMLLAIQEWSKTEQWQKQSGQFIPQPYTWLNRGGWDDELPKNNYQEEQYAVNDWINNSNNGGFF